MRVMVFDTETTGFPLWGTPSDDPAQPHLVQYTAVLFSLETQMELAFDTMIIRPDGWTIPEEASAHHHITTEQALEEGVPLRRAVNAYQAMLKHADQVSGFNLPFDFQIMRIAMLRCGMSKQYCTELRANMKTCDLMHKCAPLCRIPPTDKMMRAGRKTFKTPTLTEAMKIIMNETLDDAHDSRADVLATMRLYLHLNRRTAPMAWTA